MKKYQVKRVRNYRKYSDELKRKIGRSYLAGEASYSILAEENGLKNKGVVKEIVKWYRRKLASESSSATNMPSDKTSDSQAEVNQSQLSEIIELRKQLRLAELKNEMLETMIDVADKELDIDIRKKSGTNQ